MGWKAFFYRQDNTNKYNNENTNTYVDETFNNKFNLKTRKCSPQIQDTKAFEEDLLKLIKSMQFTTVSDEFLNKLNEDINKV